MKVPDLRVCCVECGYDLGRMEVGVCPECGGAFDVKARVNVASREARARAVQMRRWATVMTWMAAPFPTWVMSVFALHGAWWWWYGTWPIWSTKETAPTAWKMLWDWLHMSFVTCLVPSVVVLLMWPLVLLYFAKVPLPPYWVAAPPLSRWRLALPFLLVALGAILALLPGGATTAMD